MLNSPAIENMLNSEFDPTKYPAFPEDITPVPLETISLSKLLNHHSIEEERLFSACKILGFFYLDLSGSESGQALQKDSDQIAHLAEEVFRLPLEEKLQYSQAKAKTIFGYKVAGGSIVDEMGTLDTAEFFNVSKDYILNDLAPHTPRPIVEAEPLLRAYVKNAHATGCLVLSILAAKLDLPPHAITDLHRLTHQSGDHIRLTRGPPRLLPGAAEIASPAHTDFGSVTILFNWLGGLQLWHNDEWLYVKPRPGHALCNLGDAAVKFTNGVLRSGRHRVVPAPGEQGKYPRYSIVYFVRPEDNVVLKQLHSTKIPKGDDGELFTASEWIIRQARKLGVQVGGPER